MTLVVNRAAIETEIARRREIRQNQFIRWIAKRFVLSLAAFSVVTLLVRLFAGAPPLRDMTGWALTLFFGVPAFIAFFVTIAAERLSFGDGALDADRVAARLQSELDLLTAPGWPLRMMRFALQLGIVATVLIGVVVYWTGRPAWLARGSDAAIAVSITSVMLASIAIVFAMRTLALFLNRDLVERV
jgi:hypothetical protein